MHVSLTHQNDDPTAKSYCTSYRRWQSLPSMPLTALLFDVAEHAGDRHALADVALFTERVWQRWHANLVKRHECQWCPCSSGVRGSWLAWWEARRTQCTVQFVMHDRRWSSSESRTCHSSPSRRWPYSRLLWYKTWNKPWNAFHSESAHVYP